MKQRYCDEKEVPGRDTETVNEKRVITVQKAMGKSEAG